MPAATDPHDRAPQPRDLQGKPVLVLDASSAVALLLDLDAEERTAIDGAHLIAPTLLSYEVTNTLRRLKVRGELSASRADNAIRDFSLLDIEFWAWLFVADRTWQLSDNLSSYDAAYIALAEVTNGTVLTRDARMARAPGIRCPVNVFSTG